MNTFPIDKTLFLFVPIKLSGVLEMESRLARVHPAKNQVSVSKEEGENRCGEGNEPSLL